MQLLSLYVRRVQLCQKLLTAESRLHNAQQHLVQYADKPSQNATLDEDHLVPAGNAANAPYSHADTHGVVPSMAGHQLEQQFLIQLEADALLGRLSDDGSSPSPSTTVTGNSPTSSVHDVGARANNIETDVSSALLAALTPPITASDIVASTANEGAQVLQWNDEIAATTATTTSAAVGADVMAAGTVHHVRRAERARVSQVRTPLPEARQPDPAYSGGASQAEAVRLHVLLGEIRVQDAPQATSTKAQPIGARGCDVVSGARVRGFYWLLFEKRLAGAGDLISRRCAHASARAVFEHARAVGTGCATLRVKRTRGGTNGTHASAAVVGCWQAGARGGK
ncbi:hypothetical protein FGB62_3g346 [Gracilaria domingensis]|nr:hypothetical protein FGB62_3g346 [Gracilaria domingensis]